MVITISSEYVLIGIIIILTISISILMVSRVPEKECPKAKIIEKSTRNPLDIQFSKENFPSNVHNDMFVKSTPWIGGYTIGMGRTYVRRNE